MDRNKIKKILLGSLAFTGATVGLTNANVHAEELPANKQNTPVDTVAKADSNTVLATQKGTEEKVVSSEYVVNMKVNDSEMRDVFTLDSKQDAPISLDLIKKSYGDHAYRIESMRVDGKEAKAIPKADGKPHKVDLIAECTSTGRLEIFPHSEDGEELSSVDYSNIYKLYSSVNLRELVEKIPGDIYRNKELTFYNSVDGKKPSDRNPLPDTIIYNEDKIIYCDVKDHKEKQANIQCKIVGDDGKTLANLELPRNAQADKEIIKALGKLDDKVYDANDFLIYLNGYTVKSLADDDVNKIVDCTVKVPLKTYSCDVSVMKNGKEILKDHLTGKANSTLDIKTGKDLQGVTVDSITVNGQKVDKLPTSFGTSDQKVVINLKEVAQDVIVFQKVVDPNGNVVATKTNHVKEGDKLDLQVPKYDTNKYKVAKVLVNNKEQEVPKVAKNCFIVYQLQDKDGTKLDDIEEHKKAEQQHQEHKQESKLQYKVIDSESGKVLKEGEQKGNVGDKIKPIDYFVKDKSLEKILVNGKEVNKIPETLGESPTLVEYYVQNTSKKDNAEAPKEQTIKVKVVDTTSKTPVTLLEKDITGKAGSPYNFEPVIDTTKYDIASHTNIPKDFDGTKEIVYNVKEKPKGEIHIKVLDLNTKKPVVSEEVSEGYVGQKTNIKPNIDESKYTVMRTTVNGKDGEGMPDKYTEGETDVVYYILAKDEVPALQKGNETQDNAEATSDTVKEENESTKTGDSSVLGYLGAMISAFFGLLKFRRR